LLFNRGQKYVFTAINTSFKTPPCAGRVFG
jgi:hypothetical protein